MGWFDPLRLRRIFEAQFLFVSERSSLALGLRRGLCAGANVEVWILLCGGSLERANAKDGDVEAVQ